MAIIDILETSTDAEKAIEKGNIVLFILIEKNIMKHIIIATLLLIISAIVTAQTDKNNTPLEGEWVGIVNLGKEAIYMRLLFKNEEGNTKIVVLSMQPDGISAQPTDVNVKSPRIQFQLKRNTVQLLFDGKLQGKRLAGNIRSAQGSGVFQFVRHLPVDPKLYDEYAGPYELGSGKFVIIRRGDGLNGAPPFSVGRSWLHYVDNSGRTRILFCSSKDKFFSGPSYLVPLPVEVYVAFIRNKEGIVTGLRWRENGQAEIFAPRSKLYKEESVHFQNGNITLAARLLTPTAKGSHPAVVLIQGGPGPGTRNEQYLIAGDILARHGIATLIYDKQGCGGSSGDWRMQSYEDMAKDALAGVEFLLRRKEIDPNRIGLWGISEGGWIAPIAASRSSDIAFVILISAAGISHAEVDLALVEPMLRQAKFSEQEIQEALAFEKLSINFARSGKGWDQLEPLLGGAPEKKWFYHSTIYTHTAGYPPTSKDHWFWTQYRLSADLDPVATLRKVTCPVLAIWGELDAAMPYRINKKGVEQGLKEGKNKDFTLTVFPKGGHILWLEDTGNYIQVKKYVPGYFDTTIKWILKRVRRQSK